MASTITTVTQTLVDSKVAAALRYLIPLLNSFSFKVDMTSRLKDDVIRVPIAVDPTPASKTAGTMGTAGGSVTGTSVTLSNFYYSAWDATEGNMASELFQNYWADKIAGSVYGLAKTVIDAALGVVTAANYGNTEGTDKLTVAAADFGQSDLALLWQYAATKIKQREISLGLNAAYAGALLGDSALACVFATGGTNFVQSGQLPRLIGMNTWAYPAFPANAQNLGGAVFGRAAVLVGTAPPVALAQSGEGDIVERRVITDAESGVACLYTMTATGGGTVTGECCLLYGVAKGQDAVVRLVSA